MKKNGHNPTYLVLIIDKDLSAFVSQESVRPSISALNCSHASLLAGPRSPETAKRKVQSGVKHCLWNVEFGISSSTVNKFYFGCVINKEIQTYINMYSFFQDLLFSIHSMNSYLTTLRVRHLARHSET